MKQYTYDVIVVGTGAAGYNAACRIRQLSEKSVAIVTEDVNCGTSRNGGSDKQTYYKLGLGGDAPDSVHKMAENLFAGGSVDGDNALCEAALSVRSFMNLCEQGVPFPVNRYGEYIGYKTDHDIYARATSAGPLTSKYMTEALQKRADELGIPVLDGFLAVEVLTREERVCGLLCLEIKSGEWIALRCGDLVLATGGPAGIYADVVYPVGHTGSTGLALRAGAKAQNLTEWQYGLASVQPRWNVSGTYMQVLPRFVSVDENGREYDFLEDYFRDAYTALSTVFLKGYQWPFDSKKVLNGSSVIDLLVYRESVLKKRRVYLDFTKNPFGLKEIEYEKLSGECREYLEHAGACFGTPIERLLKMNVPAVELYQNKGLDITKEYLQIALCAQHNNGGISVNLWWQTTVKGLFAVGECAGTHGVARPGGAALNAGQVGSLRAAQYISEYGNELVSEAEFDEVLELVLGNTKKVEMDKNHNQSLKNRMKKAQRRMSDQAAAIRNREGMQRVLVACQEDLALLCGRPWDSEPEEQFIFYKLRDVIISQMAVLTAMIDYVDTIGKTRGSALYYDVDGLLREGLEEMFRFTEDQGQSGQMIQEVQFVDEGFKVNWRQVRPLPEESEFFENVWKNYRLCKNIF